MTEAAAREIIGSLADSTCGTIAIVEPVVDGPMIASTSSWMINRRAKAFALLASLASS